MAKCKMSCRLGRSKTLQHRGVPQIWCLSHIAVKQFVASSQGCFRASRELVARDKSKKEQDPRYCLVLCIINQSIRGELMVTLS